MNNPHLIELISGLEERFLSDTDALSVSEWIVRHTTMKGRPFSFEGYEFQRAIADDMHPDLAVPKCSQIGLTEIQIRKTLCFLKRNVGVNAILTFPDGDLRKRNSQTRVRPIVEGDRAFNLGDDDKAIRSVDIMQFGRSFLYITGCQEKDATSTSADMLMHDELDLSPQDMIGLYQSRLQNSLFKITQRFSTPTFELVGIDKAYSVSDMREFMCRCPACNHHNIPAFEPRFLSIPGLPDIENLEELTRDQVEAMDLINAQVVCERCQRPLDLTQNREWVATYPNRSLVRGYKVRPFSTSRLSVAYILQQLLKYKDRDYIRGWRNTVLGEPYVGGDVRLTEADIKACMGPPAIPDVSSDTPVFIGIDVGQACHLVLGSNQGVFLFEVVHANELELRVKQILATYRVVGGAVDRHPYTPTADRLRELSGGVILPVEYRGTSPIGFIKDEYETLTHLQANRTQVLDEVMKRIRKHSLPMVGYGDQKSVIVEQLRDLIRDEQPDKPAVYVKQTGNDHYAHALAFLLFSMRVRDALYELQNPDPRQSWFLAGIDYAQSKDNLPAIVSEKRRVGFNTLNG